MNEEKKLIQTAEKLIQTIGVNLIADDLIRKLNGIKQYITAAEELSHKYRDVFNLLFIGANDFTDIRWDIIEDYTSEINHFCLIVKIGNKTLRQRMYVNDGTKPSTEMVEFCYHSILSMIFKSGLSAILKHDDN